jgi:hypothetical protein
MRRTFLELFALFALFAHFFKETIPVKSCRRKSIPSGAPSPKTDTNTAERDPYGA